MEKMEKIFSFDRADTCPTCKSKRSIEAYTRNGKEVHLSLAIDLNKDISHLDITCMKYKNSCNDIFIAVIYFIGKYPTTMTSVMFDQFMNSYKEAYKKSETTQR